MANKGNFRAPWHDYRSKAKYMITLNKLHDSPKFGDVYGLENAYTLLSSTGTEVKNAIGRIGHICESIKLWQYIVMPDHVHFLIKVEEYLDEPLGNYIARLKADINARCGLLVFEHGFNDQIINPARSLDAIFQYIKQNPYRLAVRLAHPDYFRRINDMDICGMRCQVYGNLDLLRNPFKDQVVCHRHDSETAKASNSERWIYTAANGGVLVSPFIARSEKNIRELAEEAGGRIILISNHKMRLREKPAAHDFSLCEQGRLLIISPYEIPEIDSRPIYLAMNDFAEKLCRSH